MSKFSKRVAEDYNRFRRAFQWLTCNFFVCNFAKLMYDYKVEGRENIPQGEKFIVAANHISGKDPFLIPCALKKPVAFMAKEELFEKFFSKKLMDWCGAFAVKRDKVEVSTIKTALAIKDTSWMLGLFPQGTRDSSQNIDKITKGFATFAKVTKTGILPVAIIGADKKIKWPFSEKLTIKIGHMIPYSDNVDEMMNEWCRALSELTGKNFALA